MATSARQQPPWTPPAPLNPDVPLPPLRVLNSLTRTKNEFIPLDPKGKLVTWYSCGPTLYDDAHLGHARNYVSTDILRRIMKDYFGFQVRFVQNLTDIDDKIILRGRQQYLLAQFKEKNGGDKTEPVPDEVIATACDAFSHYIRQKLPLLPPDTTPQSFGAEVAKSSYQRVLDIGDGTSQTGDLEAKLKMHIRTLEVAAEALNSPKMLPEFYLKIEDILLPYLDSLYSSSIGSHEHDIFFRLTRRYEIRFFEDMRRLNVLDPDVTTKVSEFIPETIAFVQRIIANGFGYPTPDGSVYFDIEAFEKAGHFYARLEPWSRNDRNLQADGEGSLANSSTTKRNQSDFALWKTSKSLGEPSWPSPWGPGRPGWHAECSVMCSEILGKKIDIHSGGEDLKFPHHDNELAQSTAYWSSDGSDVPWINYFLHTGHLRIQGLKMSKSLKNFTTIREALSQTEWTPRSLRICFLLTAWHDKVEVNEDLMASVTSWEDRLDNFFLKAVDVAVRTPNPNNVATDATTSMDKALIDALEKTKANVHSAFCDSFNTPAVMKAVSDLVAKFNATDPVSLTDNTVLSISRWVTRIVTILGLVPEGDLSDTQRIGWSGSTIPASARPFIYPLSQLRDVVRKQARSGSSGQAQILKLVESSNPPIQPDTNAESTQPYRDVAEQFRQDLKKLASSNASANDLLALCDQLRDTHLFPLGIYLEDRGQLPAMVRPVNKALLAARQERESTAAAKREAKAKRMAEEAENKRLLAEKAKLSPVDMFRTATEEYSEWDEQGIPTKDAKGEEIAKSRRKKLVKEWQRQQKLHEEWLKQ